MNNWTTHKLSAPTQYVQFAMKLSTITNISIEQTDSV